MAVQPASRLSALVWRHCLCCLRYLAPCRLCLKPAINSCTQFFQCAGMQTRYASLDGDSCNGLPARGYDKSMPASLLKGLFATSVDKAYDASHCKSTTLVGPGRGACKVHNVAAGCLTSAAWVAACARAARCRAFLAFFLSAFSTSLSFVFSAALQSLPAAEPSALAFSKGSSVTWPLPASFPVRLAEVGLFLTFTTGLLAPAFTPAGLSTCMVTAMQTWPARAHPEAFSGS